MEEVRGCFLMVARGMVGSARAWAEAGIASRSSGTHSLNKSFEVSAALNS